LKAALRAQGTDHQTGATVRQAKDRHELGALASLAGLVGPASFVAGWLLTGSESPHYSQTTEAISQLARIGAPHRWLMTLAFFVFGLAMLVFAPALARRLGPSPLLRATVTVAAIGTLGVAAFPLAQVSGGIEDHTHVVWAVVGYIGMVLSPLVGGWLLQRRHRSRRRVKAVASYLTGCATMAALIGSSFSSHPGLWQRSGLTITDIWFMVMAVGIIGRADGGVETPPSA
jgi:hypothetical membrane protein